jgi:hypothetical protein
MLFKHLLLLCTLIASCATPFVPLFAESPVVSVYKGPADLQFTIDGVSYTGLATVPHKVPYTFKFNIPKDTERLILTSCHRRWPILNPKEGWLEWLYQQRYRLEDTGFCILYVDALSKTGTVKSAEIDFTAPDMTGEAFVTCNGIGYNKTKGASICQAPVTDHGLLQMVQTTEPVDAVSKEGCMPMKCENIWCYFVMIKGDCWYSLVGKQSLKKYRLVTRGYLE